MQSRYLLLTTFLLTGFFFVFFSQTYISIPVVPDPKITSDESLKASSDNDYSVSCDRDETEAEASSSLPYDLSTQISYEPVFSFDENWSTSWCSEEEHPNLTLTFNSPTDLGKLGLVGGYATTEELYFQNDRIKSLGLSYNGSDPKHGFDDIFFLEDTYDMQFVDLNEKEIGSIRFEVLEVYPGSKYTDLCLAEIDIWSDFVATSDAKSARTVGLNVSTDLKFCEDGTLYQEDGMTDFTLLSPETITGEGSTYRIPEWGLSFVISEEFEHYHAFRYQDEYLDYVNFVTTVHPECIGYGDSVYASLAKNSFEGDPAYFVKDVFELTPVSGNTYREGWLGGHDILTYTFSFKNIPFSATSLVCRQDKTNCQEPSDSAFIRSLLSTLH